MQSTVSNTITIRIGYSLKPVAATEPLTAEQATLPIPDSHDAISINMVQYARTAGHWYPYKGM